MQKKKEAEIQHFVRLQIAKKQKEKEKRHGKAKIKVKIEDDYISWATQKHR